LEPFRAFLTTATTHPTVAYDFDAQDPAGPVRTVPTIE
jgi:hypothetical protein